MEEKKFEDMMDNWASQEIESTPKLRPTKEMYAMVKAKKRKILFPVFVRWATVATAAATILLVVILRYPEIFRSSTPLEQSTEREELFVEQQKEESPKPAIPAVSSAKMDEFKPGEPELEIASPVPVESAVRRAKAPEISPILNEKKDAIPEKRVLPVSEGVSDSTDGQVIPPAPTEVMAKTRAVSESRKLKVAPTPMVPSPGAKGEFDSELGLTSSQFKAPKILSWTGETANTKHVGSKIFHLKDGVWVDAEHSKAKEVIKIKRDSQAYHDLITAMSDWKAYFEISQNVIVNIGEYSIEIADNGKTALTENELKQLVKE